MTTAPDNLPAKRPVLLYDGQCGLCNRFVGWLLRTDHRARLSYAPLQSSAAQDYLRRHGLPTTEFDSLVFVPDWNHPAAADHLLRTDGVLAAADIVGGIWRLVTWMRVLPSWFRDPFYQLAARARYALFGEYRPVPLQSPEWEKRFL